MRAIIIDDERNAITALEIAIKDYCPEIEIIGTAQSAIDGIKEIQLKQPELVFTDIEMPNMTGLELIESFSDRNFEVIFVTAYNQYAIKAFKVNAIDYLLKPINIIELINSVKKIKAREGKKNISNSQVEKLKIALSGKLSIPISTGSEYLNIHEIIRIEADGSYVNIYSSDSKVRCVTKNLKSFEESLEDESFFRCHKSHLINLKHIAKYSPVKDGGYIEMTDKSIIPVSRDLKNELFQLIKKYTI